ncbi:MAG: hypothetical protein ACRD0F_08475, partial [Acidimicrobiales bacterium]
MVGKAVLALVVVAMAILLGPGPAGAQSGDLRIEIVQMTSGGDHVDVFAPLSPAGLRRLGNVVAEALGLDRPAEARPATEPYYATIHTGRRLAQRHGGDRWQLGVDSAPLAAAVSRAGFESFDLVVCQLQVPTTRQASRPHDPGVGRRNCPGWSIEPGAGVQVTFTADPEPARYWSAVRAMVAGAAALTLAAVAAGRLVRRRA